MTPWCDDLVCKKCGVMYALASAPLRIMTEGGGCTCALVTMKVEMCRACNSLTSSLISG